MLDSHKLLTDNLELDPDLETFLNEGKWSTSTNYVTMSIIGAQGTGKSTLINSIFGTEFETKKSKSKNKEDKAKAKAGATIRTTIGADLSIIKEAKDKYFLLIDSEGIGCGERLKDCKEDTNRQSVFEKRLTSFVLSAVDVLLVNILVNQIGHAVASCRKLLPEILEINAKYIQTDRKRKKTIIYVIRDFDEDEDEKGDLESDFKRLFEKSDKGKEESKSIEENRGFKKIHKNYNTEFEFVCHYKSKRDFLEDSKNIKSKIWSYFEEKSNKPKIESLINSYNENLRTIFKYCGFSADQLKIFYNEMIQRNFEIYNDMKKAIIVYSELKKLYSDKDRIVKAVKKLFKAKFEKELHWHDEFINNKEDLMTKINELLMKKGRSLFDKEIEELSNFHNSKVHEEILSADLLAKPGDFKKMKLKQIEGIISDMVPDKFELK